MNKPVKPMPKSFWSKILSGLGLSGALTVKVYHGYGHQQNLVVYGHVLSLSPSARKRYSGNFLFNFFALIRLFMVRPVSNATVHLRWNRQLITSNTGNDGLFKFEWRSDEPIDYGWHPVIVELINEEGEIIANGVGSVLVPHSTQYAFISDIDDTFLISHSSDLLQRMLLILTQNARSRNPFEGVVKHYNLLMHACTNENEPNPFFYISSSEWNLYDYILEFTIVNELPVGIFLLNQLKVFRQMLRTGQNNHATKFMRIVRVIEAFPKQQFILLGDSSQHDPEIYQSVAKQFPGRIRAIYIRDIHKKNKERVSKMLSMIEQTGVPCCFFAHSAEAIQHSVKIGLINAGDRTEVTKNKSIKKNSLLSPDP